MPPSPVYRDKFEADWPLHSPGGKCREWDSVSVRRIRDLPAGFCWPGIGTARWPLLGCRDGVSWSCKALGRQPLPRTRRLSLWMFAAHLLMSRSSSSSSSKMSIHCVPHRQHTRDTSPCLPWRRVFFAGQNVDMSSGPLRRSGWALSQPAHVQDHSLLSRIIFRVALHPSNARACGPANLVGSANPAGSKTASRSKGTQERWAVRRVGFSRSRLGSVQCFVVEGNPAPHVRSREIPSTCLSGSLGIKVHPPLQASLLGS